MLLGAGEGEDSRDDYLYGCYNPSGRSVLRFVLSSMSVSEQEEVATWFKKIMKEYGVTPIIISHVRKSANGVDSGPQRTTHKAPLFW